MDDLSFGIAMGQRRRADSAQAASLGLVGVLGQQMANAQEMRDRIATLELALAVKTAHAEGLTAQVRGLLQVHPDSPERGDTGKRYKDGGIKTVGRIRYIEAFDACLIGKKITNPTQYRAD